LANYLMESSDEAQRLEGKTQAEETRRQLAMVGLLPGMRALDAGAGTGAVAREMAAMVGASGSVVAFDASQERLDAGKALAHVANLEFICGDLYAPTLAEGTFDFIWCRFIFEYLADADAVMIQFRRLLKPGGKLVVGDLDGNTIFHYPMPPEVEEGLPKLMKAIEGRFDPYAGRKLFHRFRTAAFSELRVRAMPYHFYPGTIPDREIPNWEGKVRTMRGAGEKAFGSAEAWDRFATQYLEMLRDPDSLTYSILFLVEGTKPLA